MLEWIFDGVGTEIISLIIGTITGGAIGYKVGIKKRIGQRQIAKDGALQEQVARMEGTTDIKSNVKKIDTQVSQVQKAGNHAIQSQSGDFRND